VTIEMFQNVPIVIVIALRMIFFNRKTGHIYVGAWISAVMITWIVVAEQATRYPF